MGMKRIEQSDTDDRVRNQVSKPYSLRNFSKQKSSDCWGLGVERRLSELLSFFEANTIPNRMQVLKQRTVEEISSDTLFGEPGPERLVGYNDGDILCQIYTLISLTLRLA